MNIITGVFFMLLIKWELAIIVLVMIPILVAVSVWFKQKIIVQFRLARKINSKITGSFNENITGVRVVKALRRERKNLEEFNELTGDITEPHSARPGCRRCSCPPSRSSAPLHSP
jgi:ATP-binding cassette subfamily B protein